MLAPNFFVRLTRSVESLSKKERLSVGSSGIKEKSSVVVEVDFVSEENEEEVTLLLIGVCGK